VLRKWNNVKDMYHGCPCLNSKSLTWSKW
jgi:hypothetical protein